MKFDESLRSTSITFGPGKVWQGERFVTNEKDWFDAVHVRQVIRAGRPSFHPDQSVKGKMRTD